MKKHRAIGALLKQFITAPSSIRKLLYNHIREESARKRVKKKYGLSGLDSIELLDLMDPEGEHLHHYTFLGGNSRVTDIALLKALGRGFEGLDFLEIGTWRGETIINMADIARRCVSISLPDEMVRKARGEKVARMQRLFSEGKENIQHIHQDSKSLDPKSLGRSFDLIFIDGEHSYEGVYTDTKNAFELLKDERSMIVWHDFSKGFEDLRFEVLEAALDACPSDAHRSNIFRVDNTLCGVYMPNPPKKGYEEPPLFPHTTFDISIKGKKL